MTPTRKLLVVAAMFAITTILVFVASATSSTAPLFAMFVPLLVVPWALTRPVPGEVMPPPILPPGRTGQEEADGTKEGSEE